MYFLKFVIIFSLISSSIELEISAPSFPDIVSYFGTSEDKVGLTITYNLIGFCLASLIYGPLSEHFGRRKIMIMGNLILVLGSIGCVMAPNMDILLISRFIQGLGAATSAVLSSAIIADCYKTREASKLYGAMNAIFSTLMAISPIIGGIVNKYFGWRANYLIVAVICVASLLLMIFSLPETKKGKSSVNLKKISKEYCRLLSNITFLVSSSVPSILYGCYLAFVSIAPFIYMDLLKLNITTYTVHQGVIIAAFAIPSIFAGKITDALGERKALNISIIIGIAGFTSILFAKEEYLLTFSMSLVSVSDALIYPIIFARSMEIFPDIKGIASSAIMSLRYLICSSITAAAIHLYDGDIIDFSFLLFGITSLTFIMLILLIKNNKNFVKSS